MLTCPFQPYQHLVNHLDSLNQPISINDQRRPARKHVNSATTRNGHFLAPKVLKTKIKQLKPTCTVEGCPHHSHTAGHSQVPETHRLILRARRYHPAPPRVQRQDMTWREKTTNHIRNEHIMRICVCIKYKVFGLYLCVRSARAGPVPSGSQLYRCYSLRLLHWLKWPLRSQDPP